MLRSEAPGRAMIDLGWTSPDTLAIHGRSNGGLQVGAAANRAPGLFAAALPAVGVMDMLRFNQVTAGRFWVDDYGSPQDPELIAEAADRWAFAAHHTGLSVEEPDTAE